MANPFLRIPEIKVADKTDLLHSRKRRKATSLSTEAEKRQSLPLAKLIVLVGCVSLLAALFLAAEPDFRPDILRFQARVGMFMVRYTMPICFFQLGVFWILYLFRKRRRLAYGFQPVSERSFAPSQLRIHLSRHPHFGCVIRFECSTGSKN